MTFLSTILADVGNNAFPDFAGGTTDGVAIVGNFITKMVTLIFIVGSLAFFFMFLLGGVRWITSGGDKGQVESSRAQIIQAITGIIVLFSVYAVARFIKTIFGVDIINIDLAPLLNQ